MAAKFSIEAIFKAVDKMTAPLQKMTIQNKKFTRSLRTDFAKAQRQVDLFGKNLSRNVGRIATGTFIAGITGASFALKSFITEASKIEDAVAGFTPLLGGVEKAEKLVEKLNQTAATTPFQFAGIAGIAKQLLPVMNGSIEDVVKTFRILGDTAGGNIQKLESITRGFTKALLKGKPDMESLNMIAEAGVPIFSEMAASMGITKVQLFELSKQGKLTSDDLVKTFERMTNEGGIFFQGMEIASKTLTGKFSTLKDNIALTAATIGTQMLPILKPMVDRGIEIAGTVRKWVSENKELINSKIVETFNNIKNLLKIIFPIIIDIGKGFAEFIKIITPLAPIIFGIILAWKAYRIALLAAVLIAPIITFVKAVRALMLAQKGMNVIQAIWNVLLTANPVGLIITAIGVLIGVIIALALNWDKVTAAVKRVWNWFSNLLDNPIIAAAALIFAPFFAIPALIIKHWEPIRDFFIGLWEAIRPIIEGVGKFFKDGTGPSIADFEAQGRARAGGGVATSSRPQAPISPSERSALIREETISRGEVTIKDESGRAEMTQAPRGGGFNLSLVQSGGF